MPSLRRLCGILAIAIGVLWLVRSYMGHSGADYWISAGALVLGGALAVAGKPLVYLAIGWGIFIGSQLSMVSAVFGMGQPLDLLLMPFVLGLLGIVLTVIARERERRS